MTLRAPLTPHEDPSAPLRAGVRQSPAARWYGHAAWVLCQRVSDAYGFELAWEDHERGRLLLLAGPDSPSELTLFLPWRAFDGSRLEATSARIIRWMLDRGVYWTGREVDVLALNADETCEFEEAT